MADTALADFLAREELGSPIEAAKIGAPANRATQVSGPGMVENLPGEAEADPNAYPRDLTEAHSRLVRYFEEAERASAENRRLAERDRDYYDHKQWTEAELQALRKRGQPDLTIDYISRKVDLLSGLERKARTDPKAYPRTPAEEERADAATQALRFIADDTNFPQIKSSAYEDMLIYGFGGAELGLADDGKGGAEITITPVGWDRLFHDPHSRSADFRDARYLGMVLWMDRDQLLDMYPDAEETIGDTFAPQTNGSYNDKPGSVAWQDNLRERARVVQIYWSEGGDWWAATLSRAGFLAEPTRSPFLDRKGRTACPLLMQSAYVDRENNRYGMVRRLISLQDEINKRRSKALHLLSVNRVIAEQGAVDDEDKARREVAKPDGWVTVNGRDMRFEIASGGELATGQFQLLQHATSEMQAAGPNASMAGNDPRDLSGRAILAQQSGGAAQNEPLADALRQWARRVYELAWMAARQFWRGERWIRVTDDMGKVQFVGLNRQVRLMDELAEMPPDQRAMVMQQMQLVPGDPRLNQVIRTENEISDLEVDITIEEGPDVPALQAEQFAALVQLAGSQPGIIPPDVLIAASALRDKEKLLERMKQAQEQSGQTQQQQAAMAQQAAQAQLRETNSKAAVNEARAVDLLHGAVGKVAAVHKAAAESPILPVDGPGIQPQAPTEGASRFGA
jgi:hypothetical protein